GAGRGCWRSGPADAVVGTSADLRRVAPSQVWLVGRGGRGARYAEHQSVRIAPPPVLPGLERPHQRMVRMLVEVPGRVLVRGAVAAADVPADHADAQVHPGPAGGQTVLAAVRRRRYLAGEGHVSARVVHG